MALTRVPSTLPADLEALTERVLGSCLQVHKSLGPGLSENVYSLACAVELEAVGIPFERELSIPISYRDRVICHQRIDLFIDRRFVLEVKSVERIHPVHVAQVVGYLRLTGARVGFVVNFNVEFLKQGLRRVVL